MWAVAHETMSRGGSRWAARVARSLAATREVGSRSEVKLVPQSARVDLLLLRRVTAGGSEQAHKAQQREPSPVSPPRSPIMRGLWPRLPLVALVLVAPRDSDGLQQDLDYLGWRLHRLGNGYATLEDAWYTSFVGFTDEICEAEHDDFLRIFSNTPLKTHDVANWLRYWMTEKHDMRDIRHREGFDSISDKFLDLFTPEERLSGLEPEQRLAGLSTEQMVLALPAQLLRVLPEEYIASLPDEVQRKVRARLAAADVDR